MARAHVVTDRYAGDMIAAAQQANGNFIVAVLPNRADWVRLWNTTILGLTPQPQFFVFGQDKQWHHVWGSDKVRDAVLANAPGVTVKVAGRRITTLDPAKLADIAIEVAEFDHWSSL